MANTGKIHPLLARLTTIQRPEDPQESQRWEQQKYRHGGYSSPPAPGRFPKVLTGPAEPARHAEHQMVCGEMFPATGSNHEHICHSPARRPNQVEGVPKHECGICGCTWITLTREAGS
jgi:hypothetical protein